MNKILKGILALMALVVAVLLGMGLYLTQVMDPNSYRADIEAQARAQGVPLRLQGPISWAWYPQLGLALQGVVLEDARGEELLRVERMASQVALAPLLQGAVVVEGLDLDGVQVNLRADAQGRGNWEDLPRQGSDQSVSSRGGSPAESVDKTADSPGRAAPVGSGEAARLNLAVARIGLSQVRLDYQDQQNQTTASVSIPQCAIKGFNLDNRPFQLDCSSELQWQQLPVITVASEGELSFDQAGQQLTLHHLEQRLTAQTQTLQLQLSGVQNLQNNQLQGQLEVQPFNAHRWLKVVDVDLPEGLAEGALTAVALKGQLDLADQQLQLRDLQLQLDDSQWQGSVSRDAQGTLAAWLKGDRFNLDRYFPPTNPNTSGGGAPEQAASSAAASEPTVLPDTPLALASLRQVSGSLALSLGKLQANGVQLSELALEAQAVDGLISLQQLSARLYDGELKAQGQLNARQSKASLSGQLGLTSVSLQPLLTAVADEPRMQGQATLAMDFKTQGASLAQWQQAVRGQLQLSAQSLLVNELDVERNFCELAALVSRKPMPQLNWKNQTTLQDVSVTLDLQGTRATLTTIQAGVEELSLKAGGVADYLQGDFDIRGDLRVVGTANRERACQIRDRWRNRDLPLRCRGNLNEPLSGKVCGPDRGRIDDLLKAEARDRLEEKLEEKLQDKLKEKFKDGQAEQVEQLLRGLFGR